MSASLSSQPSDRVTAEDVVLMQGLAQRIVALRPDLINPGASFGELVWIWGKEHAAIGDKWRRKLWFADTGSGEELVAWGWASMPHQMRRTDGTVKAVAAASVTFQVHPDHAELIDEVIAWFEGIAPDVDRRVIATTTDKEMLARWTAFGYELDPAAPDESEDWTRLNERSLDDIAEPTLPEGFQFRTAGEVGPEAAAQANIDAWHPSTFSLEAYEGVRSTAAFRDDLHILVEAPDGTLAASTIMWFDEANRTAEFEPVGTHPDFRRRGLAQAMLLHGMHVVRTAGATHATVACLGVPGNAALRLYESVGFRELSRDAELVKRK
jgi:ribosomal protein S18 acetylase RimI-like enzyme